MGAEALTAKGGSDGRGGKGGVRSVKRAREAGFLTFSKKGRDE